MFRRLNALIWLRTQILFTNKNILVPVIMPYCMVLLFKMTMSTGEEKGIVMMALLFSMAIGMAVGSPISTMISEEKEKKNLNSLLLSGIRPVEYVLSVLFYPICISLVNLLLFPLLTETNVSDYLATYIVSMLLTSTISILINFYVGLVSNSQSQAQIISMVINMFISLAPSLSMTNASVAKFVDYSFMGFYTAFYNNPQLTIVGNHLYTMLFWMVLISLGIILYLKTKGVSKVIKKIFRTQRVACLNK